MSMELSPILEALGWTLLHSLWQSAIIAIILFILLKQLKSYESNLRYFISLLAMGLVVFWSAVTFQNYYISAAEAQLSFKEGIPFLLNESSNGEYILSLNVLESMEANVSEYFSRTLPWFMVFWALGLAVFLVKNAIGLFEIHQLRKSGKATFDDHYYQLVEQLAKKLRINQSVKLLESARIRTPMVIGFLKPVILFPAGLVSGLSPNQIEAVLLHELAHIKRQDYLINLFQTILDSLFFFNPFFWFISARIREERENCCDDIALEFESDPIEYARALTLLGGMNTVNNDLVLGASSGKLYSRIKRMFNTTKRTTMKDKIVTMTLLTFALAFLVVYTAKNFNELKDKLMNPEQSVLVEYQELNQAPLEAHISPDLLSSTVVSEILEPMEILIPQQDDKKKKSEDKKEKLKKELKEKDARIRELEAELQRVQAEQQRALAEQQRNRSEIQREMAEKQRELAELERELARDHKNMDDKELSKKIEAYEELHEKIHEIRIDPNIDIDIPDIRIELLNETLDEIKIELKEVIKIEDELLELQLEKLQESLEINEEVIRKEIERAMASIEIDEEEIRRSLEEAGKQIKEMEMKFKVFEKEIKKELVKDGLIDNTDEDVDFHYKNDRIYINGDKLSPELNEKYVKLWEEFFDEEVDIRIH